MGKKIFKLKGRDLMEASDIMQEWVDDKLLEDYQDRGHLKYDIQIQIKRVFSQKNSKANKK